MIVAMSLVEHLQSEAARGAEVACYGFRVILSNFQLCPIALISIQLIRNRSRRPQRDRGVSSIEAGRSGSPLLPTLPRGRLPRHCKERSSASGPITASLCSSIMRSGRSSTCRKLFSMISRCHRFLSLPRRRSRANLARARR